MSKKIYGHYKEYWDKNYNNYLYDFYKNQQRTGNYDIIPLRKTDYKRYWNDINWKVRTKAKTIADSQFYQTDYSTAKRAKQRYEEETGEKIGITELRQLSTAEIADQFKAEGVDLGVMYHEQVNAGLTPAQAKRYISQNYFGSP